MRFLPIGVVSLLALAGCAVGPDYERPEVDTPEGFHEQLDQGEAGRSAM